jgi:hypothetical protein
MPSNHFHIVKPTFGLEPKSLLVQNLYRVVKGFEMEGLTLIVPLKIQINNKMVEWGD